jgi:hypothetical protein
MAQNEYPFGRGTERSGSLYPNNFITIGIDGIAQLNYQVPRYLFGVAHNAANDAFQILEAGRYRVSAAVHMMAEQDWQPNPPDNVNSVDCTLFVFVNGAMKFLLQRSVNNTPFDITNNGYILGGSAQLDLFAGDVVNMWVENQSSVAHDTHTSPAVWDISYFDIEKV